jgi:hypothetical protein
MLTDHLEIECDTAAIRARKALSFILIALIMICFTSAMTWANACLLDLILAGMH